MSSECFRDELGYSEAAGYYAACYLDILQSNDVHESRALTRAAAGLVMETVASQLEDSAQIHDLRKDIGHRLVSAGADEGLADRLVKKLFENGRRSPMFCRPAANPERYGLSTNRYRPKHIHKSRGKTDSRLSV